MPTLGKFILIMVILFVIYPTNLLALDEADTIELQIYREMTPQLRQRVLELENKINITKVCDHPASGSDPACEYQAKWWAHQSDILSFNLKVLEWQIFAANCVLAIISILVISGILSGFYQLWIAAKIASFSAASTELELSSNKIRVQTSVVGISMIIISGVFLIFFLREVYKIEPVNIYGPPSAPRTTTDT